MIGLSIVTNFKHGKNLFPIPNNHLSKVPSNIDFDFLDFLIKKYAYSKVSISGGTDPLCDPKDYIIIEIIKKIAFDNKIKLYLYTKSDLSDKFHFLKYISPTKLVICNHLMSRRNLEQVAIASRICPVRLYLNYNNQKPPFVNIWVRAFRRANKKIEFSIKENDSMLGKRKAELCKTAYVIQKGDYNSYLMPDNNLYNDFNSKVMYCTGYNTELRPEIDY